MSVRRTLIARMQADCTIKLIVYIVCSEIVYRNVLGLVYTVRDKGMLTLNLPNIPRVSPTKPPTLTLSSIAPKARLQPHVSCPVDNQLHRLVQAIGKQPHLSDTTKDIIWPPNYCRRWPSNYSLLLHGRRLRRLPCCNSQSMSLLEVLISYPRYHSALPEIEQCKSCASAYS